MQQKRVVITGLGALAPNGNDVASFWAALIAGKSGIGPISSYDTEGHMVTIAGELSGFDPEDYLSRQEVRKLDRFSILALIAAEQAVKHSGIMSNSIDPDRVGVMLGTGVGGIQTLEDQHSVFMNRGPKRISPQFVPKMIANIAAGHISIRFGFQGPNQTITSACSSATDAIGIASRIIRYGDADIMITGGSEASVTPLTIAGFANMRALSRNNDHPTRASRPFEKNRDGFVLGEGAGVIVLESLDHARRRGAVILAELAGYGATDDAFHVTQPASGGAGAVKAMRRAVEDAGLNLTDIDYINAHGTSTPYNDRNETAAIKTLFEDHAATVKISSTKSMTGHLLGAAGGIEAIAAVKALQEQILPPTINYDEPDPECDLDYTPNTAQKASLNTVLSNTFGFGGHNGVICLRRWVED
ncbi:MAG: beta-ketoacyl-ACP synthase II [Fidelibacterota bacterium]